LLPTLAPSTARVYRGILERFAAEHGAKPLAGLTRKHIDAMLAKKATKPAAANNWLQQVKALTSYGVREGFLSQDPARDVPFLRRRSTGIYTWSEDDILAFESRHPVGGKARLALALLLYTAQRRSDVLRMGRPQVRNGVVHVRQQKTGKALAIPLHPALQAILDATPCEHLTFLTTAYGKPFSPGGFSNWFRDRCLEAGLPKHCTAHGLRKAAARRLAEGGCSANVIAAITGHATLKEVARYTQAADQEQMARQGIAALSATNRPRQSGNAH
jgi:integrase